MVSSSLVDLAVTFKVNTKLQFPFAHSLDQFPPPTVVGGNDFGSLICFVFGAPFHKGFLASSGVPS